MMHHLPYLEPIGWLGVILAACGVTTYAFRWVRMLVRFGRKCEGLMDDWRGEPERPGFPARPGIPERIARIEEQLRTNGGTSLKDQTNRIEDTLNAHIVASGGEH